MKQRVISGAIVAIITIISILVGGWLLKGVLAFIAVCGCYEATKIRKEQFNIFIFLISLVTVFLIWFFNKYAINVLLFELICLLTTAVFDEKESLADISYTFLISFLLGYGIYFFDYVESFSKWMLGYVFVVSYITDVFALFTGMKFGKHKLNERISPKKTIEGSIGGWIFGCVLSLAYAYCFHWFNMNSAIIIFASICLPLISQIGDLVFSMMKRFYGVKDFSNLIPGHGGILDRLDSSFFSIIFLGSVITLFI